ncbi:MAG: hypothetical protein EOP83_25005 [Verrucomicrobiaceae bacterium]|nr:MAG: hypothetical protein EOP83_25005 [Verrucomicrobiaceae bacterium]
MAPSSINQTAADPAKPTATGTKPPNKPTIPVQKGELDKAAKLADKLGGTPGLDNPKTLAQKVKSSVGSVGATSDQADMMTGLVQAELAKKAAMGESAPAGNLMTWDVGYRAAKPAKGLQWYTVQAETFTEACKVAKTHYGREPYAGPLKKNAVAEAISRFPFMEFMERPEVQEVFAKMAEALGLYDGSESLLWNPLIRDGHVERQKSRGQAKLSPNQWADIAQMAQPYFAVHADEATFTINVKRV